VQEIILEILFRSFLRVLKIQEVPLSDIADALIQSLLPA